MPSLDDLLVQPIGQGWVNATSAVTSLGSPTTAGTTLLIFATTYGTTGIATPSGYTRDTGVPSGNAKVYVFRKSNIAAGETLPTLATGASTQKTSWFALELSGLDLIAPLDVAGAIATATAQSISSNGAAGTSYDAIAFTLLLAQDATSTTPTTWSGYSGSWVEVAEQGASDATTATGSALACNAPLQQTPLPAATNVASSLGANGPLAAVSVKYMAAGSKTAPDYRWIAGFEQLTSAGLATGLDTITAGGPVRYLETITGATTVLGDPAKARNGNGCLRVAATASISNATAAFAASARVSVFAGFRSDGALPAADTEIVSIEAATGVHCVVRYLAATGKVGVKVGAGTEQVSAASLVADTWHTIDLDYDMATATLVAAWRLDGVEQPQASHGPVTATSSGTLRFAQTAAGTFAWLFDDVIVAGRRGNWPLGDHRVALVKPSAAALGGGSAANLGTFSANGTIAAFDAATALARISEGPPPTIGASADGLVQVTADTITYAAISMETPTLAADEVARAVRMLVCGWAASGTANTIQFRGHHGADTAGGISGDLLFATADPGFDNSTTAPAWLCRMYTPTAGGGWTQQRLDDLGFRMGFSDDATPDVGVHWVGAEVAVAVPLYVRQDNDSVPSGAEITIPRHFEGQSADELLDFKATTHAQQGWTTQRGPGTLHAWKTYTDPDHPARVDRYFEIRG